MVVISHYRLGHEGEGRVYSEENSVCPACGGSLRGYGRRKRKAIKIDGAVLVMSIRRLQCQNCRKIHHELPNIVMPYKRHCSETIEKIIVGEDEEIGCEESTIRRVKAWWTVWRLYFESVIASLLEKDEMVFSIDPTPREIVRTCANAYMWPATRSAFLTG